MDALNNRSWPLPHAVGSRLGRRRKAERLPAQTELGATTGRTTKNEHRAIRGAQEIGSFQACVQAGHSNLITLTSLAVSAISLWRWLMR